ncbi:hypothetical protein [Halalkalibacter krulwichiae]|uniref:Uncharacterized protein n=1 Tax=Halalkalibacter krulwichiae TaxID=199441 RepID=A0A1Y9THJ3_9BACI|nr:hypothetical protein [Halalkalibacter krulwichiae]ARK28755.1 hypothetical protein BkAM31D_02210 [Halalkalibacter krulwichiae]
MNLLEQYILEVFSVEPYESDWTSEFPERKFVKVNMKTTCYGVEITGDHIFNTEEWEKYQKQGYYMA